MNVTTPLFPKQIGSATLTDCVPEVTSGKLVITNESVIVPDDTFVVHAVVEFSTTVISIVVVPALVRAEAGILNVAVPPLTTTPEAV